MNSPKQKTYQSKRLLIRPLKLSDYSAWSQSLTQYADQPDKHDVSAVSPEKRTREFFRTRVLNQKSTANKDLAYIWNLFLKNTGELIGHVDVATIMREPYQMANLGYFIIHAHRRQGYASEALAATISGVFRDLRFHRLEAAIDVDNRASIKLARAAGLYREGIKKHYWFQNNRWEDQVIFIATPELFRGVGN